MKKNTLNLVLAIIYLLTFGCFLFSAVMNIPKVSGILYAISSACFFIASVGSFYTYLKNKKKADGGKAND